MVRGSWLSDKEDAGPHHKETTKNKENVVNVYEAARKVLSAIYNVSLED